MSDAKEIRMGNLMDVYLSGFVTGAGSVLHTLFPDRAKFTEEELDREAECYLESIKRDPLMMAALQQQIVEIIEGIDSPPFTMNGAVDV